MDKVNLSPEAQGFLESWFITRAHAWEAEGADVEELKGDVYSHIYASLTGTVSVTELKSELSETWGDGELSSDEVKVDLSRGLAAPKKKGWISRFFSGFWKLMTDHWFGLLVWPVAIVVLEYFTSICGDIFFSPVSRWEQMALLVLTAMVATMHYRYTHSKKSLGVTMQSVVRGMGMTVSAYWAVLLVPVIAMGTIGYAMGVIFSLGIGLLAFPIYILCISLAAAPVFLWIGYLRKRGAAFSKAFQWVGVCLGVLLLVVVEGPIMVTRYGVDTENPKLIRDLGSDKMLLEMQNEGGFGGEPLDTTGYWISITNLNFEGRKLVSADEKQKIANLYYQVTGKPSNAEEYASRDLRRGDSRRFDRRDDDLGGDGVMRRVQNLAMSSARYDCHVDAASGLGYWESTYEFSNTGRRAKEARMQVLLPPGGVVSRLTLWINGEPREAAFAATAKVTKAYRSIAVEQRRDPVLVRWMGPDRVLVQCFPVPEGGKMKIRLGVTAEIDAHERLFVPRVIEQNFSIVDGLEAAIWVQGDVDLQMDGIKGSGEAGKWRETHGEISMSDLMAKHAHVDVSAGEAATKVFTIDQFAEAGSKVLVRETAEGEAQKIVTSVVLAVDGSSGVAPWRESISEAVETLRSSGVSVSVVVASEEQVLELSESEQLSEISFVGGQDNLPTLLRAYELAVEKKAAVIWLHGDQPVSFDEDEVLAQRLKHGFYKPQVMTVDLTGGPNRVLEDLGKELHISGQARPSAPSELAESLQQILVTSEDLDTWTRLAEGSEPADAVKVWDQLARWKVWNDVSDAKPSKEVTQRAAKYQLVSPVSGAVVLETQAQYDAHGLKPIDASTAPHVPVVPEPHSAVLLLIGGLTLLLRRSR